MQFFDELDFFFSDQWHDYGGARRFTHPPGIMLRVQRYAFASDEAEFQPNKNIIRFHFFDKR